MLESDVREDSDEGFQLNKHIAKKVMSYERRQHSIQEQQYAATSDLDQTERESLKQYLKKSIFEQ